MSTLRDLRTEELTYVSGGYCGWGNNYRQPSWGGCFSINNTRIGAQIGATAGYVAGVFNFAVDALSGASNGILTSDLKDLGNFTKIGAQYGAQNGINGALSLYQNVLSAINTSLQSPTVLGITFPPPSASQS